MSKKNTKTRNAQQNKPRPFSLAGCVFLVMEGPEVRARGHIVQSPQQGAHHLVQFGNADEEGGVFFRMLSNDSLQQGTIHPNHEECNKFVAGTQAAYGSANDEGGAAVPNLSDTLKGDGEDGLPTPEEKQQADIDPDTGEDITGGGKNVVRADQRFVGRRNETEPETPATA